MTPSVKSRMEISCSCTAYTVGIYRIEICTHLFVVEYIDDDHRLLEFAQFKFANNHFLAIIISIFDAYLSYIRARFNTSIH